MEKEKNRHVTAILMVILDSLFFSLMAVCVREAGNIPTMQKAFFRNVIAGIIAVGLLMRSGCGTSGLKKRYLPDLIKRSLFGGIGLILNFWAIDHIGLADASILNKMSPFFAVAASIFILGEKPNHIEVLTILTAFAGCIFVIKPGSGLASIPALAGLLSGLGAGIAYTYVRRLEKNGENGPTIVAFFSLFTCLLCLPFVIAEHQAMTGRQWLFLILAGCCAALAQFAVTAAYKLAPAKEISVFDYSQVLFASIWGFLVFHEVPDVYSWIGYGIIISMAVFKWYYNLHSEKQEGETENEN